MKKRKAQKKKPGTRKPKQVRVTPPAPAETRALPTEMPIASTAAETPAPPAAETPAVSVPTGAPTAPAETPAAPASTETPAAPPSSSESGQ
jgi:hypothetical protein